MNGSSPVRVGVKPSMGPSAANHPAPPQMPSFQSKTINHTNFNSARIQN